MQAIKVKYLSATTKTGPKLKAICEGGTLTESRDYAIDASQQALQLAFKLANEKLKELLQENGDFDINIIYHHAALDYLKENDPSLKFSLEIAESMGFELKSLNSETLASLLASENAREEFGDLRNKIEEFFTKLQEQEEEAQQIIDDIQTI